MVFLWFSYGLHQQRSHRDGGRLRHLQQQGALLGGIPACLRAAVSKGGPIRQQRLQLILLRRGGDADSAMGICTKVGGKTESLLGEVQKTSFNLLFDPLLSVLSYSKMREMIFPATLTGIGNIYYGF